MNPLVSVIMPAYNASKYIRNSIESVINQTYHQWELLIVNDCSKDDTLSICQEYEKHYCNIRVINLEKNSGVAIARNVGIKNSQGKYIAFLDSDDIWGREKLKKQLNLMNSKDASFVFSSYEIMKDNGEKTGKIIRAPKAVDYNLLLKGNSIGCLTVLIDREKVKNFEMPLIKHEDYATWLKILYENDITAYSVQESLAYYRRTAGSVSSNKIKSITWNWKIYHDYLRHSKLKSTLMLVRLIINNIKKYKKSII